MYNSRKEIPIRNSSLKVFEFLKELVVNKQLDNAIMSYINIGTNSI